MISGIYNFELHQPVSKEIYYNEKGKEENIALPEENIALPEKNFAPI
ncbi:hypothetical protein [Orientia tsutsugamushi]|nr:hypothetical protein [Orientia tsutsugamushi]